MSHHFLSNFLNKSNQRSLIRWFSKRYITKINKHISILKPNHYLLIKYTKQSTTHKYQISINKIIYALHFLKLLNVTTQIISIIPSIYPTITTSPYLFSINSTGNPSGSSPSYIAISMSSTTTSTEYYANVPHTIIHLLCLFGILMTASLNSLTVCTHSSSLMSTIDPVSYLAIFYEYSENLDYVFTLKEKEKE